jgi:Pectate lyase superfamily protein
MQIRTVLDFGAIWDGVADDTTAVRSAFASASHSGIVIFPPGRYLITKTISVMIDPGKALTIQGCGQDVSILHFPTGNGINVEFANQYCSIHVRDVSLTTGSTGPNDIAFALVQQSVCNTHPARNPLSDFTNVTLRGDDGYDVGTHHWAIGVKVTDVSVINFTNLGYFGGAGSLGYGVILTGIDTFAPCGGNPAYGVVYNFYGCTFETFDAAIVYGTDIQGVAIASCNFTEGNIGVFAPGGAINLDQLSVTTSQFGSLNNGILLQSKLNSTTILGNLFIVASNQNGIVLNSDSSCITGNVFAGTGAANNNGVFILDTIQCIVTGNSFSDLITGVALTPGASGVNIQSNSYRSVGTPVFNNGGLGNMIGSGSP